jgi:hypothetical protein
MREMREMREMRVCMEATFDSRNAHHFIAWPPISRRDAGVFCENTPFVLQRHYYYYGTTLLYSTLFSDEDERRTAYGVRSIIEIQNPGTLEAGSWKLETGKEGAKTQSPSTRPVQTDLPRVGR